MAVSDDVKNVLANEAKIRALEIKIAKAQGGADSISYLARILASQSNDSAIKIASLQTELSSVKTAVDSGITDEYGERSTVDNAALAERNAGNAAVIAAIRSNPSLTQEEAVTIWSTAGLASHPSDRQWLLHNPIGVLDEYLATLLAAKLITEATWAQLVAYVMATPDDQLA